MKEGNQKLFAAVGIASLVVLSGWGLFALGSAIRDYDYRAGVRDMTRKSDVVIDAANRAKAEVDTALKAANATIAQDAENKQKAAVLVAAGDAEHRFVVARIKRDCNGIFSSSLEGKQLSNGFTCNKTSAMIDGATFNFVRSADGEIADVQFVPTQPSAPSSQALNQR